MPRRARSRIPGSVRSRRGAESELKQTFRCDAFRRPGFEIQRSMTTTRGVAVSAVQFLPPRVSLPSLRRAAAGCRGCPLYQNATQTVFGAGKRSARLILVGEQPGNDEDLAGEPFVGPAGR